jgi:hypothetical protein
MEQISFNTNASSVARWRTGSAGATHISVPHVIKGSAKEIIYRAMIRVNFLSAQELRVALSKCPIQITEKSTHLGALYAGINSNENMLFL